MYCKNESVSEANIDFPQPKIFLNLSNALLFCIWDACINFKKFWFTLLKQFFLSETVFKDVMITNTSIT